MNARTYFVAVCLPLIVALGRGEEPTRVLLIGKDLDHPYGTHMYMFECGLLAKCLGKNEGFEPIVSNGWPKDPSLLDGVDVIVTYSADGGTDLMGGRHKEAVRKLLDQGVGLVALHWSTGAANNEIGERWRDTLGGWFSLEFSRLNVTETSARQASPDHPISRGWTDFPLRDEYYLGLRFKDDMTPIVVAKVEGEDFPVAWAYTRPDGGRSFGFVCGHFHDVFLNDSYRRIVVNAIHWAAQRDVPAEGSTILLSEGDGTLPPEPPKP